jgi:hypothetical protein
MWRIVIGPEFPGHSGPVYADELRSMAAAERAKVFRARMDAYFKQQVGTFAPPNRPSDFPLVVMTCIGIETLGAYRYGDLGPRKGNPVNKHLRTGTSNSLSRTWTVTSEMSPQTPTAQTDR